MHPTIGRAALTFIALVLSPTMSLGQASLVGNYLPGQYPDANSTQGGIRFYCASVNGPFSFEAIEKVAWHLNGLVARENKTLKELPGSGHTMDVKWGSSSYVLVGGGDNKGQGWMAMDRFGRYLFSSKDSGSGEGWHYKNFRGAPDFFLQIGYGNGNDYCAVQCARGRRQE